MTAVPAAQPTSDAAVAPGFLAGVHVVELGGGRHVGYAGRMLADLGARVTVVRPADAAPAQPEAVRRYLDRGKAVIAADRLGQLDAVDVVIVDGDCASASRAAAELANAPVTVVEVTNVAGTPDASAFDACARGGVSWVIGEPDREPLTLPDGVVDACTGSNAAAAALVGVLAAATSGPVRFAVSGASVLAWYVAMNALNSQAGVPWHREGRRAAGSGGLYPYGIFPCADGEVVIITRSGREWRGLLSALGSPAWARDERYLDQRAIARDYADEVDALLIPLLRMHTAEALMRMGEEHGFAVASVNSMRDVLDAEHFRARRSLVPLDDGVLVPNMPYRFDVGGGAPARGRSSSRSPGPDGPLAGLRVVDLGWVWSGPLVGGVLADLGAQVVKVEHGARPDSLRLGGRLRRDGREVDGPRSELAPCFLSVNRGKRGLALDLADARGAEVARRLIATSDVVVENMRVGVLARLGLGYAEMRELNPGIVYLAMSAGGQFGPMAGMRAYAPIMSCLAGMESLVGYPGEPPVGMMTMGLGDPNATVHGLVALLAALRGREETGVGAMIDLSQSDALLPLLAGQLIEQQLSGEAPVRGNRLPGGALRGIFPTSRAEEWIAITASDASEWQRFTWAVRIANQVRPAAQRVDVGWVEAFATAERRERDAAELDAHVAAWTRGFRRDQLLAMLHEAEIVSSAVNTHLDLEHDPALAPDGFWDSAQHPVAGRCDLAKVPWWSSDPRVRARPRGPAPLLGQHSVAVLRDCGYADAEIDALVRDGVVS